MDSTTGFIYYLQNPLNGEIFYIGQTQYSLKNRLNVHYQHLKEFEKGLRNHNKRYEYLIKLKPLKAEIGVLEIVTDLSKLDEREISYIKAFREICPNLTNMTDGGKGNCTSKYYTEEQMEKLSERISRSNKGRKKPEGFSENLSRQRKGKGNPAAKEMIDWLVCFQDNKVIRMFKYGFEINNFINNYHAYGNVYKIIRKGKKTCYGYNWYKFSDCSKEIQDIVHTNYENNLK